MESGVMNQYYGQCRCCLEKGYHQDMTKEDFHNRVNEIFFEAFMECFNLFLSNNTSLTTLICTSCVTRIKDAVCFKTMVISSEIHLLAELSCNNTDGATATESIDNNSQEQETESNSADTGMMHSTYAHENIIEILDLEQDCDGPSNRIKKEHVEQEERHISHLREQEMELLSIENNLENFYLMQENLDTQNTCVNFKRRRRNTSYLYFINRKSVQRRKRRPKWFKPPMTTPSCSTGEGDEDKKKIKLEDIPLQPVIKQEVDSHCDFIKMEDCPIKEEKL